VSARHLVIMNPAAGRRHGRDPRQVLEALRGRGLLAELMVTERRGHARDLVREHGPRVDVIVVVGGDGTLHEVLQDLDLERHRLGIVPWGTGNDFAWSLGVPEAFEACLGRIAAGAERQVDLGAYELEHPGGALRGRFHNQMGFGFEALVNEASHRVVKVKGAAVYVWAFLKALPQYRTYPCALEWEGGSYQGDVLLLAVGNGKRVGGAFLFFPKAAIDDGRLDLLFTEPIGGMRAPFVFPRVMRGTHAGIRGFHEARIDRLQVSSSPGIPVYADGEFLVPDARSVRITTLAGALRSI
jgi:diacylglycerol kinase (ATP)